MTATEDIKKKNTLNSIFLLFVQIMFPEILGLEILEHRRYSKHTHKNVYIYKISS